MNNKITFSISSALLIFCLMFAGCNKKKTEDLSKKAEQPAIVDVLVAQNQIISSITEANGSIVAYEFVELHPEVSGRII